MSTRPCQSILYVDDDPDICEVVQATLRLVAGLDVHTAGSGEQAIDLAYELRPDLILMDVMMPGLDGPATLKRMRNSELIDKIPVVFLTAKVLPEEVARFLRLGAIGVIAKPFDPLKLGEEVLALWEGTRSSHEISARHTRESPAKPRVTSLENGFLERTKSDAIRLAEMFERVCTGDQATLKEFERIAHSIHGAGAMFGFPQLSAAGWAIEQVVEEVLAKPSRSASTLRPTMLRLLDCTQHLANEVETVVRMATRSDDEHHRRAAGR
jgi:two-component system, OmpR family, response regulator